MNDLRLLSLLGLRLKGFSLPGDVADMYCLPVDDVEVELERSRQAGLVAFREGDQDRWVLLSDGRMEGEVLLAQQLDALGAREVVETAYHQFMKLNQPMLAVCTRWQVRSQDPLVLNDHSDRAYDAAVIAELAEIDTAIQQIGTGLVSALDRFGRYGPGFGQALSRLEQGEIDWLTKPTVMSYHTLWFQLHEDLLATLGLDRASEAARFDGSDGAD